MPGRSTAAQQTGTHAAVEQSTLRKRVDRNNCAAHARHSAPATSAHVAVSCWPRYMMELLSANWRSSSKSS